MDQADRVGVTLLRQHGCLGPKGRATQPDTEAGIITLAGILSRYAADYKSGKTIKQHEVYDCGLNGKAGIPGSSLRR
jgi:hypothetical protein